MMVPDVRLRLRYKKRGKIRFISHRDVARAIERAVRLSATPVGWSQGFSPRPLISFGLALPTGAESEGEFVDIRLDGEKGTAFCDGIGVINENGEPVGADPQRVASTLALYRQYLPEGLELTNLGVVGTSMVSLQEAVDWCDWELEVVGVSTARMKEAVEGLLAADAVILERERKGRSVKEDIRPAIATIAMVPGDLPLSHRLDVRVATQPRGVRPKEIMGGLGGEFSLMRSVRLKQWIETDGHFFEPLACSHEARATNPVGVGS